ncbi:hypothetical protein QJS10_CPA02g01452 [Acorus calamus]|uniref:TsaA-like domain-containing protein n=1 Tax=Acorus calamus TaxID=4465 RepID=A0AAV9FDS8_ACOCL|nr:hypothetical protein QJS10_CPA02g01452 [Acorus calamus]
MATSEATKWPKFAVSVLAALSSSLLLSFIISRRKTKGLIERVRELEASLEASVKNCSAERRGRIRAQQKWNTETTCACSLGSGMLDLDKLWSQPSRSKFKAKVRVPILQGGKMGVLATRSPHRPCPIGLTVAKVEAVDGHAILLSGVDLVDGTPVLDIKPYLPYSDSIQEATIPKWVVDDRSLVVSSVNFSLDFASSLANCWVEAIIGVFRCGCTVFTSNFYYAAGKIFIIHISHGISKLNQAGPLMGHKITVTTNTASSGNHGKPNERVHLESLEQIPPSPSSVSPPRRPILN